MDTHIPEHHPLRQLFGSLAEKVFVEKLGWSDFKVTEYVSTLLVDFTRSDQLYRIKNSRGDSVEAVAELLYESEVTQEAGSFAHEREVHRHIGDFTLFMAGLFPEYLKRIKTAKDFLIDYIKTGKRSYGMVAEFGDGPEAADPQSSPPLFRKLAENFELCVLGLGFIRGDLERLQDRRYQQARRLLN